MTARFTELCIDCADPKTLAAFWKEVLEWHVSEEDDDSVELVNPESEWPVLLFARVPEKKTVKNRLHIDVSPRDRDQKAELERLLALGATHADVGQGEDASWVVLKDPEGNEFCLLRTPRP